MGPLHVDLPFGFVHQVQHVGTTEGVNRNAFAASDVADDGFAPNRVTTTGAVDQQVALPSYANGVVVLVASKDAPHNAGESTGLFFFVVGNGLIGRGREASQDLSRRKFAVADARHEIVGSAHAIIGCDFQ